MYSVRPATEDDLDQLTAIEARVHKAPWSRDHFKSELEKDYAKLWLLTDDETDSIIVGYISFWLLFDELQVLNVAVDLPYRGMGYAKLLVRKSIDEAMRDHIPKARLEVRETNEAAFHLYQKIGFQVTQTRKGFYSDGESAKVMELVLNVASFSASS